MDTTLFYFHDPMCSWCWGFRPAWLKLLSSLPESVNVEYVLGGLAPDSDQAMPMAMRAMLQNTWQKIHNELGTEFNFDYWEKNTPRRSTYPACRALIAAEQQASYIQMLLAIQRAYYLQAMNPSDDAVLKQLASELSLDEKQFSQDINSPKTQKILEQQVQLARDWLVPGYPSLILQKECPSADKNDLQYKRYPITLNYHDYQAMLERIQNVMAGLSKG